VSCYLSPIQSLGQAPAAHPFDLRRGARFAVPGAPASASAAEATAAQAGGAPPNATSNTTVAKPTDTPEVRKIRKAAAEFESMLLSNWWRSMKESGFSDDGDDTDPGKDTLDQLGMQAMSAAVANGGGLGIGAMLVRSLLSNVSKSGPSAASKTAGALSPAGRGQ
jgi:hypothetical protein